MAKPKTPSMSDIFAKTTGEQPGDPITSSGLGLRQSEWAEINRIAAELGIKPHAVTVYAVRYFMAQYKAGKIQPETKKALPKI